MFNFCARILMWHYHNKSMAEVEIHALLSFEQISVNIFFVFFFPSTFMN